MNQDLQDSRLASARQSRGISIGAIYNLVVRLCQEHSAKGQLLDYGAGIGNLLGALHTALPHLELTGADILERPPGLNSDIQWFEGDLNHPLPRPAESYDVIVSSEVIEHLENPRATFRDLNRLLKPGGLLIVTTPNQESLRAILALLMTGHFVAFSEQSYPAHITALLRKDFQRIATETGFSNFEFNYSDEGGIPKFPQCKWQKLVPFLGGRWFSDNIAFTCWKPNASSERV
jgi:2-polyprenyl-3-methyl-5-hydroxy-6-metoxy-1,4-benzoquinol methylase